MNLYQQFLQQARQQQRAAFDKTNRATTTNNRYERRNSDGETGEMVSRPSPKFELNRGKAAKYINNAMNKYASSKAAELNQYRKDQQAQIASERQSALEQQIAQRHTMAQQAEALLKTPAGAPNIIPDLAPLQETTGVALNTELAGANNAQNAFYVAPDSTGSAFNVTSPVGGGGLGVRNRASTSDLTSDRDTLGSKRKDEL